MQQTAPTPQARTSWTLTLQQRRQMAREWFEGQKRTFLAVKYGVHPRYVTKAAHRMGLKKRAGE